MKLVTWNARDGRLKLGGTSHVLHPGVPTEVPDDVASRFGKRGSWAHLDVTVADVPEPGAGDQPKE